jgi:hypothetical protein
MITEYFELLAQSRVRSAYFIVARRGKNASAHWCTMLMSAILDGLSMHLWCRRVTASSA